MMRAARGELLAAAIDDGLHVCLSAPSMMRYLIMHVATRCAKMRYVHADAILRAR